VKTGAQTEVKVVGLGGEPSKERGCADFEVEEVGRESSDECRLS
jgi:hypothetical protein